MRIDSKAAVQQAGSYFRDLFPTAQDVRLEEVELSPDGKFWLVTYSFAKPDLAVFGALVSNPSRDYKVVKIEAETGIPQGVKIKLFTSDVRSAS
jgi:hypothetical protein